MWGSSSSSGSLDRSFVAFPPGVCYQNLGTSFKITYGGGCCKHLGRKTDPWWSGFPVTTSHTAHYLSLLYMLADTVQCQKKAALIHKRSRGILLKNQLFIFCFLEMVEILQRSELFRSRAAYNFTFWVLIHNDK